MRLGIIGLPQSGKTTIFNALTRGDTPIAVSGGRFEVHTAVVDVPDPRVDRLSAMFDPGKITYANRASGKQPKTTVAVPRSFHCPLPLAETLCQQRDATRSSAIQGQ